MSQEQAIVKVFNIIRSSADKINEIADPNKALERISELIPSLMSYLTAPIAIAGVTSTVTI